MLDCSKITMSVNSETITILPVYFQPPIYYSLNTAINLAAILALPETHKWYYNCMVQLAFHKDWEQDGVDHPLDIFPANLVRIGRHGGLLFAHEHIVDVGGTILKIDEDDFVNQICAWIRKGMYVLLNSDVSRIRGTAYYGQGEFIHNHMIFGYNDDNGTFKCINFDRNRQLAIIDVYYEDVVDSVYRASHTSALTLLMPKKKQTFCFDINLYSSMLKEYLQGVNSFSHIAFFFNKPGDFLWGTDTLDGMRDFVILSYNKNGYLDIRPFQALYEHKKSMLDGMEYVSKFISQDNEKLSNQILQMKNVCREAEKIKMLVMKLNMNGEKNILPRIDEQLVRLYAEEKEILTNYLCFIETKLLGIHSYDV